jgi:hypothetical protein
VTTTTIETRINRKFNVRAWANGDSDLRVTNTLHGDEVFSVLDKEQSEKLALALLGENATVITDLPEAKEDGYGDVTAGGYFRSENANAESLLENAKALLAIHKFLVEKEAEVLKAKEAEYEAIAKLNKRRDELAYSFNSSLNYVNINSATRKAIDHIIELEAAQA